MQIELLETFLDLIDTRSFNRTAERLGVTQSTVSGRVQSLEAALGARLFDRSRAGTDLTAEGVRFEVHARHLRHEWAEARRAVQGARHADLSLKIGIQNDLAAAHIGALVTSFRRALPQTAFYIEPDYSAQMCNDLLVGAQDFAVMFTPRAHPDLYFTSVGEVTYRLISSDTDARAGIDPDRYIFAHFSAAFEQAHRQLLPELANAPLSVGQSSTLTALLQAMGGAGYVAAKAADDMVATGRFQHVTDAPTMLQPVFAATHLRHRIAPVHRRLIRIVQRQFSGN